MLSQAIGAKALQNENREAGVRQGPKDRKESLRSSEDRMDRFVFEAFMDISWLALGCSRLGFCQPKGKACVPADDGFCDCERERATHMTRLNLPSLNSS
jgi:hypothetical protein